VKFTVKGAKEKSRNKKYNTSGAWKLFTHKTTTMVL
jgi:hypothetical protein